MEPLLVDLKLEAVNALGESRQALPRCRLLSSQLRQFGRHGGACGFGRGQVDSRLRDGAVDGVEHSRKRRRNARGDFALGPADHGTSCRLGCGLALALALTLELQDARLTGADA